MDNRVIGGEIKAVLDRAIDDFYIAQGTNPKFIIFNASAYGEAAYVIGKSEGLDDEDAYLNNLSTYRFITVAVTHQGSFCDFKLI